MRWMFVAIALVLPSFADAGEPKKKPKAPTVKAVDQLAEEAKKSLAVILFTGRDGKQQGLGTGFVVRADGLLATNYHVLGEARPIKVQLSDGKKFDVTSIHASDKHADLALLKIDAKDLVPLPIGDSSKLKIGQPIAAMGHPKGLEYSIVSGVLSGQRTFDGVNMLQLAIPIEQGNSGGPVLDGEGRVVGIVTMKSLVTNNLGFAIPSNALQPLLTKPNPIPMENWLTIGQLDKTEWKTSYGGRWRQRAGRIIADGTGTGFGGRTVCLNQRPTPPLPYEMAVTLQLDDESGAAGLIFGGDGEDRHYGFYPSGGKFRITRFQGPDVFSWKILQDAPSSHYRPGEWNTIKVRVEKKKFSCYVNDELFHEEIDPDYFGKLVGLAKFRQTVAEFKKFQIAPKVASERLGAKAVAQIDKAINDLPESGEPLEGALDPLIALSPGSVQALRERARQLEKQAESLRKWARVVHQEKAIEEVRKLAEKKDFDLVEAGLLLAKLDNDEVDVEHYKREVDRMGREVLERAGPKADDDARLQALNEHFFKTRGFHGSRVEYYSRANSYLNEVIDDREGLPITLSILYMETARRAGLNVVGLALPAHFMVRVETGNEGKIVDVYNGGLVLTKKEAIEKIVEITGDEPSAKSFDAVPKKAIVTRMLHNLLNAAQREEDRDGVLRYLDGILAINPDSHDERWIRAVFRFQAGQKERSLADVEKILEVMPEGIDLNKVRELKRLLSR